LWKAGYKVSQKKAQMCQDTVKYLGLHLSQGQHRLGLGGNRLSAPLRFLRLIDR
jgi:hypothetical protein